MDYDNPYFNSYMNPSVNPYMNRQMQQAVQPQQQWGQQVLPKMELVRVNGKGGAEAFQIGANSQALLLDENNPIVWLVSTDGAGFKTVTPYDIRLHEDVPEVSPEKELLANLQNRIENLERMVSANVKSNDRPIEPEVVQTSGRSRK